MPKKRLCSLMALCFLALFALGGQLPLMKPDYPIRPADFTQVKLEDEFWAPRLKINRTVTIPYLFKLDEETGRTGNFRIAAGLINKCQGACRTDIHTRSAANARSRVELRFAPISLGNHARFGRKPGRESRR